MDAVQGIDLGFMGNSFAWSNRRGGVANIRERLDRVAVSPEWRLCYPQGAVLRYVAHRSDHSPIELNLFYDQYKGPKPFRYFDAWSRHPTCLRTIHTAWFHWDVPPYGMEYRCCVTRTMQALRKWNREVFGLCQTRTKEIECQLQQIQTAYQSEEMIEEEHRLQRELDEWLLRLEMIWQQKSRVF